MDFASFNTLDVAILAVLAFTIVFGLLKGLIRQVFGLAAIVAGYIAAAQFCDAGAAYFAGLNPATAKIAAFALIFVSVVFAGGVLGWIVGKVFSFAGLGIINILGGGVLGCVKGLCLVAVISIPLLAVMPAQSPLLRDSRLLPYALQGAMVIRESIPPGVQAAFQEKLKAMQRYWLEQQLQKNMPAVRPSPPAAAKKQQTER